MIRISGIKIEPSKFSPEKILLYTSRKIKVKKKDIIDWKIIRKSVDARKKEIFYVFTIDVELGVLEKEILKRNYSFVSIARQKTHITPKVGETKLLHRPVVVGTGPSGLFAGLILARMGYKPLLVERGKEISRRKIDVDNFWREGILNKESNVQFGQGGAGTFSDGKLTTLINNPRCDIVLEELVACGAPEGILYEAKPHIGTDKLRKTVALLSEKIVNLGGEILYESKLSNFSIENGRIKGVFINDSTFIETNVVILALGHSARDTFRMLQKNEIKMQAKPFAIGLRIEHLQEEINKSQYGENYARDVLNAAEYKLVHHCKNGRSIYSFCMCPGGYVVAAASNSEQLTTNGMSYYSRNGKNANSALLVGVNPQDFEAEDALAGIRFQEKWEKKAYELGGGGYHAPVQKVGDFLEEKSTDLPFNFDSGNLLAATYRPGTRFAELKNCLPDFVSEALREGLIVFAKKIKAFGDKEAILTGIETRSSSPVRILRNEDYESINTIGLYPCGEGAGYAGGIVSAAVDGIICAEKIIQKYKFE